MPEYSLIQDISANVHVHNATNFLTLHAVGAQKGRKM